MKKCPPGVICVENYSMFFLIICIVIIVYLIYSNMKGQNITVNNSPSEKIVIKDTQRENVGGWGNWFGGFIPSWPYTNLPSDPLLNPYAPPLRDERYFIPGFNGVPPGAVPINVSTNIGAVDTAYRQLGILTRVNRDDTILPLMGRPLIVNRDKWNYYTMNDKNNMIKLPISFKNKSCTSETGCDSVYNGDTVYVEGYSDLFRVTLYDNATMEYIPYL